MAVASYTTDLQNITLAETITGWSALGGGASGLGAGPDFAMEGTNCVDKQVTASEKGHVYANATAITPGANEHFFVWLFLATPGLANTLVNRGLGVVIGTSLTAYNTFHVEGSNTYGAAGRVGKCYPIRYVTTSNGSIPYRTLTGTPTANPQYFGGTANITGTVKSSNLGVDAIRRGTGLFITAGEIANPATFNGLSAYNDLVTNRYGVLTFIGGSAYELQGRLVIGQNNAGTPTLAYFDDSNKTITLIDTPHSQTDFTQIIIDHASTVVNLTNITIEAAGTNNRGKLTYNNTSTTSLLTTCSFVKIGITTLRIGVTTNGCTWRESDQVIQNSATITATKFLQSTNASNLLSNNPSLISECDFISDGTGHAIEITTAGTYTFSKNTFTNYAVTNGTTGNESIYNNSGGLVTLNVTDGLSPTYRNGGVSTTVVNNNVAITFTGLKDNTEVRIYDTGTTTELAGIENATTGSTDNRSFTFSLSAGTIIDYRIHNIAYEIIEIYSYTLPSTATSLPFQQRSDRWYNA